MTMVVYAVVLACLICWSALKVIKARRKNKVRYADGGVKELQIARAAHSNATEYIPIGLLLLFLLETNGATLWLVHILGLVFTVGRVMHCLAILSENGRFRVRGMEITIYSIVALCMANLVYFPFEKFLSL